MSQREPDQRAAVVDAAVDGDLVDRPQSDRVTQLPDLNGVEQQPAGVEEILGRQVADAGDVAGQPMPVGWHVVGTAGPAGEFGRGAAVDQRGAGRCPDETAQELVAGDEEVAPAVAAPVGIGGDDGTPPPPDPNLYATYDGSLGPGTPGTAPGALKQGAKNVVEKAKDALS